MTNSCELRATCKTGCRSATNSDGHQIEKFSEENGWKKDTTDFAGIEGWRADKANFANKCQAKAALKKHFPGNKQYRAFEALV